MPTYKVTQSERYSAVYMVEADSEEQARELIENGEIEDGTAVEFDCVGADVMEVELVTDG